MDGSNVRAISLSLRALALVRPPAHPVRRPATGRTTSVFWSWTRVLKTCVCSTGGFGRLRGSAPRSSVKVPRLRHESARKPSPRSACVLSMGQAVATSPAKTRADGPTQARVFVDLDQAARGARRAAANAARPAPINQTAPGKGTGLTNTKSGVPPKPGAWLRTRICRLE